MRREMTWVSWETARTPGPGGGPFGCSAGGACCMASSESSALLSSNSDRSTASRRSQKGRRGRRPQRRFDAVVIPDPLGSVALQFVRGFLAAYLHTLFCVTMAWILPQLQVSIADITWALFEGIAKVWLNGVVVAILFGYWAAALAFVAGVLTLAMSIVYTRWCVLLRFAPFPSRWKRALQTASNWDHFPGFWASLRGFGRAGIHTLRRVAGLCQHAWSLLAYGLENACYLWVNSWRLSFGLLVFVSTRILLYVMVQVPCYHLTTTFRWLRWLLSSCDDEGPLFDDSWCYLGSGEGFWV